MPELASRTQGMFLVSLVVALAHCKGEVNQRGRDIIDCGADSCEPGPLASCGATPHGETEQRTCYGAATVPFGSTCAGTTQSRTCDDGAWNPDFTDPCPYTACVVAPSLDCGGTTNGQSDTRTCFDTDVVPFGSACVATEQTRTCVDGMWSPDWPSCSYVTCAVAQPASCDGQPHGTVDTRFCYDAASVLYGEICTGMSQSRTCDDGTWTNYASCAHLSCDVEAGARCGEVLHGFYESRACYDASSVVFAEECTFVWQDRQCSDGAWANDYDACASLACAVGEPPDYSSEHGWLVQGTGCTPGVDRREYAAIAVWGDAVYAAYLGDTYCALHKFDATTGSYLDADEGYRTGDLGIVADATGVYTAGQVNQNWYLEKREHTTLARVTNFGSYLPGVHQGSNETLLRLEGREEELWVLLERYTPPGGYAWGLSKLSGSDASVDMGFGTSGFAATSVRVESKTSRPKFDLALGATSIYFAVRVSAAEVLVEKRDSSTGALAAEFGDAGLLRVMTSVQSSPSPVSVFEHLGRLYLSSGATVFQLNNERGNTVWEYVAAFPVFNLIADETGVYLDEREKLEHDGAPIWSSTALAARSPSLAIAGHWLYAGGNHAYTGSLCTNMRYREALGRQSRYDGLLYP